MKLSIADLRTDRHWRSATSLDQKRFEKLLGLLPQAYQQIYGQSIEQGVLLPNGYCWRIQFVG